MTGYAIRFFFLATVCSIGAANAQTSPPQMAHIPDYSRIDVNFADAVTPMAGGLKILARNVGDTAPNAKALGRHREGIGAAGAQARAPAIKAETGYDPVQNRSEQIIILFDDPVIRADIDVTYFYRNEQHYGGVAYHEQGRWRAYRGNDLIGQGLFLPDSTGGSHRIAIAAATPFDRLEMFATPYVTDSGAEIEAGLILTDSSDFLVTRISYRPENETHAASTQ